MLFKPESKDDALARKPGLLSRVLKRLVSTTITLVILGGLFYIGWLAFQPKQSANRGAGARPDLPVPVLAATPRMQDVPVYLDGVGSVRALNNVIVRAQVDGKLIAVNFTEGQDVKKGDVLGEIDPVIYKAQYDQAVAKKAQDEALLANQRIDLARYQQLAASNAGSKQQADTQKAVVAQQEALVNADQAAIDNAAATLGYTKIIAPLSGRAGLRQVDQGNIIHAADVTGLVIITQLQPIAVQFSLPQQQIMRVNAAAAKAELPNTKYQLWPGQFVNVRLKVETLDKVIVVPTSAVQRGPIGTFSYVIGPDNVAHAKPVTVTQQNETDAVIASGLSPDERVVTTGFANLSDGARVIIGSSDQTPSADLAPRKKGSRAAQQGKDGQKDGQSGEGQGKKDWQGQGKDGEHRKRRDRAQDEGDQKGATGPAGGDPPAGAAKSQP